MNHNQEKQEVCSHCKRPIDDHTKSELFSCNLEIAKKPTMTDEEATESFNKIKSGEYARMRQDKNSRD